MHAPLTAAAIAPAWRRAMDGGAAQNHNACPNFRKALSGMPTMSFL
jgi:hypothetical protein